jgi:uncharacterized membrane protein YccC
MHPIDRADAAVTRPPSFWPQITSAVLSFDRTRVEPIAALRCAIGVAVPLVTATALGQPGAAVFIAVGAVSVGFGSFQGAYRSRATVMLLASVAMALSIFAGSHTGSTPLLAVGAAAVWSFAAGLLVVFGPAGAFVGLQSTVAVLLAGAYPADLRGAAVRALMVLAGGLIQTVFVVSVWPLRRFGHERHSIAQVYRELARYARHVASRTELRPPAAAEIPGAIDVRRDPHPFAHHGETLVFQALVDEGDRLRASLAALSLTAGSEVGPLAEVAGRLLDEIADAVEEGREPADPANVWERLAPAAVESSIARTIRRQLQAAWEIADVPAQSHTRGSAMNRAPRADGSRADRPSKPGAIPTVRTIQDSFTTLRANLSFDSAIFRHALRMALAVVVATSIYRFAQLPRGYWMPMTTLLVLKPEFRETFVTGSARIVGTLIGGGFATLLMLVMGRHHAVVVAMLIVFVWLGYALFRASYTLFTICFTAYVVLLLTLSGVAGALAAEYRILTTSAGGMLALLVYASWPTWESGRAREALASLIEALAVDARVLLGAVVDPATWSDERLRASRDRARLARSNAEASVERMLAEPETSRRIDPKVALGLLAATRRYALGALALHAQLTDRPASPRTDVALVGDYIVASLESVAASLRGAPAPAGLDARLHRDPAHDLELDVETDMMVDSVNTMTALLNERSGR